MTRVFGLGIIKSRVVSGVLLATGLLAAGGVIGSGRVRRSMLNRGRASAAA